MADDSLKNRVVLVVDDEERMAHFVRLNLEQDGFQVVEAYRGLDAIQKMRDAMPDLILLDVMMPDIDGFEALQMIREISSVPVIMLTAKGEEEDKVRGLELGADDYITKPFSPRELTSRVKAVMRRAEMGTASPSHEMIEVDNRLKIDFGKREVWVDGEIVKLRPTEYPFYFTWYKCRLGIDIRPITGKSMGI
jgi:two-component system KDP operon response regulator KdpE